MNANLPSIWILEDDHGSCFIYEEVLAPKYDLRFFYDLSRFKTAWQERGTAGAPKLLIMDLRLPDGNFLDFVRSKSGDALRELPWIVITSFDETDALRDCFSRGATDYLTKPFGKAELSVKVERIFAEVPPPPFQIDMPTLTVKYGTRTSESLTAKEFQILTLIRETNAVVPRHDMCTKIWGSVTVGARTLDVHLSNIRKKLLPLGIEVSTDRNRSIFLVIGPKI